MLVNILKNIAYLYYPKGISNIDENERYLYSDEFRRLVFMLNTFYSNNNDYHLLLEKLKAYDIIDKIQDLTSLSFDRCLTFEIDYLKGDNKLIKISINISILIPYYMVYVEENQIELNPYKWITLPKRNITLENTEYKEHLNLISSIVEETIKFHKFPEDIALKIIPDISYQDVRMGDFTFFNAFFRGDNKL